MEDFKIDAKAHIGTVSLRVADLSRSLVFYTQVLGFKSAGSAGGRAQLQTGDGATLLELVEHLGAQPKPRRSTGLYHFAILTPDRAALGASFKHLVKSGYPLTGAADHLVSEALYLEDPDKNGIEIYRDRPREEWPFEGKEVRMANDEVDLDSLFRDAGDAPFEGLRAGTTMGHVHLHVRDLDEAEAFYCGILGFDVMQRWLPSALFVSAGGYHHHIGLNTWAGIGALPQPKESAGPEHYQIVLPDNASVRSVLDRLQKQGVKVPVTEDGFFRDPSGNGILLRVG